MSKLSFVTLLVVGATILGATVLREPIANAAQSIDATIVGPLDAQGNVKTHEQGIASVEVTNASVPGRDVDNPAAHPFQIHEFLQQASVFKRLATADFTVASAKRLVLEYASASCDLDEGKVLDFSIGTTVNGGEPTANLFAPSWQVGEHFVGGQDLRVYADGGTNVRLAARFSANNEFPDCVVSLSGYYFGPAERP